MMRITRVRLTLVTVSLLSGLATQLHGLEVSTGFFAGVEFRPLYEARESLIGREPAVAFLFRPDPESFEALRSYNDWALKSHACEVPLYGVAVASERQAPVVVEEILYQQGVKMPVFHTQAALLEGQPWSVVILKDGKGEKLASVDPAELESRLSALCATAAGDAPSTSSSGAKPAPGGKSGSYTNSKYGFTVRFPAGYLYREAKSGDGAVAQRSDGEPGLDIRVWAEKSAADAGPTEGPPDARAYLELHVAKVEQYRGGAVEVEQRFVVREGLHEGRDYTYAYTDKQGKRMKGRVQAIVADGIVKVASVEGEAGQFDKSASAVEGFMQSFSAVR